MEGIRILLVDDHRVILSGLRRFMMVNRDLESVGEATDGMEAVQMAELHKPDVILMDLMMPGMDGIAATREIHRKNPQVKIIALTSFSELNMVPGALQAGAVGYLEKNITAVELKNAIRSAYSGQRVYSSGAVAMAYMSLRSTFKSDGSGRHFLLTVPISEQLKVLQGVRCYNGSCSPLTKAKP
jgi:DNA-binding NarL/FixJ family response regulator